MRKKTRFDSVSTKSENSKTAVMKIQDGAVERVFFIQNSGMRMYDGPEGSQSRLNFYRPVPSVPV